MRIARRIGLAALLVVVAFGLLAGWQAYRLRADLKAAETDVNALDSALRGDDATARNQAAKSLTDHAAAASDRTDGFVWGLVEKAPVFGDDAAAVSAISQSLDTLATDAVQPLLYTVDSVDGLTGGGRIDVDKLESIQEPVQTARQAAVDARAEVDDLDSDNYVNAVGTRVDEYVDRLDDLVSGLKSGERALKVLPGILGSEGPRDYLLVFQNNAEIRATGGIPGSWAQVHVDGGRLQIVRQGSSLAFLDIVGPYDRQDSEMLPITDAEEEVYSDLLGLFWQDATFTPNWPRAAELMKQRWELEFPRAELDGVISLDPVAMSYLLSGTGPVVVDDVALDSNNLVYELLSSPYLRLGLEEQDAFFADVARTLFEAITGDIASPTELIKGLNRAVEERRFLVTLYDKDEARVLNGAGVAGELPSDDGASPTVYVGLNDATASKMSYYLRYETDVVSSGCPNGVQTLRGSMTLTQNIASADAATLPDTITGPGDIGIPLGSQLVAIRIYGPTGGTIGEISVDDEPVDVDPIPLDGRPVVTLIAQLSGDSPVPVTWSMTGGPGQTGPGQLLVTPSIQPGSQDSEIASAC